MSIPAMQPSKNRQSLYNAIEAIVKHRNAEPRGLKHHVGDLCSAAEKAFNYLTEDENLNHEEIRCQILLAAVAAAEAVETHGLPSNEHIALSLIRASQEE